VDTIKVGKFQEEEEEEEERRKRRKKQNFVQGEMKNF
jgi:hypothetical protein